MGLLFWLSAAFVTYVYAGYPLLLYVWARVRQPGLRRRGGWPIAPTNPPSAIRHPQSGVSIIIAARNEGARLTARLDNLLQLEFPAHRRQIIVVSDGSTDDTAAVLARYTPFVEAVHLPPGGKAHALNAGVARTRFDILVFADARQAFAADALQQLVAPFADPSVGAVSGELLLDAESELFENRRSGRDRRSSAAPPEREARERRGADRRRPARSTVSEGVGMYWRYEKRLRRLETAVGSMVGATGAIYAVRRELWQPLPPNTILDDVLAPMRVVLAGYRIVFNERAQAFDRVPLDAEAEARRKVRTLAGNFQILALEPQLLLPWRNPLWLQYVSHKLGRLAVPYALLTLFASSIVLSDTHLFYRAVLIAQVAFYLLAGYGAALDLEAHRVEPAAAERRAMPEVA
jgi:cellulose synthase/poly-beta-1,6-N-acetylglucosamine synthase-like glycosyltransferase